MRDSNRRGLLATSAAAAALPILLDLGLPVIVPADLAVAATYFGANEKDKEKRSRVTMDLPSVAAGLKVIEGVGETNVIASILLV